MCVHVSVEVDLGAGERTCYMYDYVDVHDYTFACVHVRMHADMVVELCAHVRVEGPYGVLRCFFHNSLSDIARNDRLLIT